MEKIFNSVVKYSLVTGKNLYKTIVKLLASEDVSSFKCLVMSWIHM